MAYYRRIRDMREDHDLTQRQLAAILHMPQPQYNQLADLYHTSTDFLLGRTEDPSPPQDIHPLEKP